VPCLPDLLYLPPSLLSFCVYKVVCAATAKGDVDNAIHSLVRSNVWRLMGESGAERAFVMAGVPDEEEWVDVDDAGKSMEGSCESAEAGCCSHEAHTNTAAGQNLL